MQASSWNAFRGVPLFLLFLLLAPHGASAQADSLDSLLAHAQAEQSSGQYAAAAADYAQATKIDAEVPELWADRGLMEYLAGQKSEAISSFKHALQLKPGLFTPLLFLGRSYEDAGKPELALPLLKKAHAMHPEDAETSLALGRVYQDLKQPERASAIYRETLTAYPELANAWFGLGVSSLAVIDDEGRVLAGKHAQSAWARALYADELFEQGRPAEAVDTYKTAIAEATPQEAAKLATTARQELAAAGMPAASASAYTQLLPLIASRGYAEPRVVCKAPVPLREQPACSYWQGNFDSSAASAARLLAADPSDAEALYWSIKSNERRAVAALTHFEDLAPHSAASSDMAGDLYRRLRQPDNALQAYDKALSIDPHDPAAHLGVAAIYLSEGKAAETVAAAKAGLVDRPGDAQLNLLAAEGLVSEHNYAEAKPYLQRSLAAPPELLLRVHALTGKIDAEEGDTAAAIEQLKMALPSDEDGSLHYQLYRLYLKIGDQEDARKAEAAAKALESERRAHAVTALESSLATGH